LSVHGTPVPSCTCMAMTQRRYASSSKAYNPYRPDPPELPKEPRRVVMKNLKFGRLAQAASAGVEGARRSLAESGAQEIAPGINSFHSSAHSSHSTQPSPSSISPSPNPSTKGNSANAGYRSSRAIPPSAWLFLAVAGVGTGALYMTADTAGEQATSLRAASLSDLVS
jgi:hypothetical protein